MNDSIFQEILWFSSLWYPSCNKISTYKLQRKNDDIDLQFLFLWHSKLKFFTTIRLPTIIFRLNTSDKIALCLDFFSSLEKLRYTYLQLIISNDLIQTPWNDKTHLRCTLFTNINKITKNTISFGSFLQDCTHIGRELALQKREHLYICTYLTLVG